MSYTFMLLWHYGIILRVETGKYISATKFPQIIIKRGDAVTMEGYCGPSGMWRTARTIGKTDQTFIILDYV